jgi:hypothetical protein
MNSLSENPGGLALQDLSFATIKALGVIVP